MTGNIQANTLLCLGLGLAKLETCHSHEIQMFTSRCDNHLSLLRSLGETVSSHFVEINAPATADITREFKVKIGRDFDSVVDLRHPK